MCTQGTFDIATSAYSLSTIDTVAAPPGTYTLTITAYPLGYTNSCRSASTTFTLTLISGCDSTTIDALTTTAP